MQFSTIATTLIAASALLLSSVHANEEPEQLDSGTEFYTDDLFFSPQVQGDSFRCEDFSQTSLGYNESSFCANNLSAENLSCNLTNLEPGFTLSSSGTVEEADSLVFFTSGRISPSVNENVVLVRFTDESGVVTFNEEVTAVSLELAILDIPEELANVTSKSATVHAYGDQDELLGSFEVHPRERESEHHQEEATLSKFQFVGLTSESAIRKIVFDAPIITALCFGSAKHHTGIAADSAPIVQESSHPYDNEANNSNDDSTIKLSIAWILTFIAVIFTLTVLAYFMCESSKPQAQSEEKATDDTEWDEIPIEDHV